VDRCTTLKAGSIGVNFSRHALGKIGMTDM
jgi:hypothetical protein